MGRVCALEAFEGAHGVQLCEEFQKDRQPLNGRRPQEPFQLFQIFSRLEGLGEQPLESSPTEPLGAGLMRSCLRALKGECDSEYRFYGDGDFSCGLLRWNAQAKAEVAGRLL